MEDNETSDQVSRRDFFHRLTRYFRRPEEEEMLEEQYSEEEEMLEEQYSEEEDNEDMKQRCKHPTYKHPIRYRRNLDERIQFFRF